MKAIVTATYLVEVDSEEDAEQISKEIEEQTEELLRLEAQFNDVSREDAESIVKLLGATYFLL